MGNARIIPKKATLLLPYQERWVKDPARLKIMEKSRQIGISWASAADLVRRKLSPKERYDAWVSSRDEIQAQLFIQDCAAFAQLYNLAAKDLGAIVLDEAKGITSYALRFSNGTTIHSMSSSPDAQAGKRGDRYLDEFALHKDPRKLYSIAYPGITWGGSLGIVSTHRGSGNYFNELIREIREKGNPKGFSLHRVTLEDALNDGFLYKLQQKLPPDDPRQDMDEADYYNFIRAGCADEESFSQEYMCIPGDDSTAFLSYDLIAACEYPPNEPWQKEIGEFDGPAFAGMDIGRRHDLTVIAIGEKAGGRICVRQLIELSGKTFSQQEKILHDLLKYPKLRRICIDATGLGMQLAEQAAERYPGKAVGITFTAQAKEQLAYPLKAAFEDRNILIPERQTLRADLRAIKKIPGAGSVDRFDADRSANGHADRFWALALLVEAARDGAGPAAIEPLREPEKFNFYEADHSDDRY